ncbi:hypothetical protein JMJ77_0013851 [Colletotrichum scovillei]|uniref:Uncharacterized protein n=1 Tax=Colletotrichum scovillei TaxID=1209932 RepID=A0A9P7R3S0_9PEZI|nr:hypothetical protein JMJ77_0013851 [Colletotrichum scovillei]KAG7065372.1 hypothetical protein JMJ78_0012126 [Colletotrichum scovillei]KAG7067973.1 hypothetical protein JMJ76_0007670 [Colletotrichum scovillei]
MEGRLSLVDILYSTHPRSCSQLTTDFGTSRMQAGSRLL